MSDSNTPVLLVSPSYTAYLAEGTTEVTYTAYVEPKGFDAAVVGPTDNFAGAAIDCSTSMGLRASKKTTESKFELAIKGGNAFLDVLLQQFHANGGKATTRLALYAIGAGTGRIFPRGDQDKVLPPLATPDEIEKARAILKALRATHGDTNLAPPMRAFLKDVLNLGLKVNTLGNLTDGAASDNYYVTKEVANINAVKARGQSIQVLNFGIGIEWNEAQLEAISNGTVSKPTQQISTADDVKTAFEQLASEGANMALTAVRLVIKKFAAVKILSVCQVKPDSIDLTDKLRKLPGDESTEVIDIGALDSEKRLISVDLGNITWPPNGRFTAAAISFEYDYANKTEKTKALLVSVIQTSDASKSAVISRGQQEKEGFEGSKQRIRKAVELARGGDYESAEAQLSEQYRIANSKDPKDQDVLDILLQHVEVVDEKSNTVRLKERSEEGLRALQAGSGSKVRVRKPAA